VRALAQNFRRRVQNPRDARYLPFARRLYDLILRPVLSDERVAPGAPLVFVPDGVLRTIPLAALHDGDGFVIETRSVTISPDRADTARPRPARLAGGTLVAALSEQREDFSPLPAARSEAVAVARLIDARQLLNDDFQTKRFATFLREVRPDIVHVASHGVFSGSYGESFLLASDGRLNFNDLEDQLSAGREAGEPISLLALSACQTAVGDERAALGLAGIALKAGAQSALASLWSISDEATATLMLRFYEELFRDTAIDKAEALRQAQLALLRSSPTRHPAFWSSFLLVSQSG